MRFDAVYTPQDVGTYKPDRLNFEFLARRLEKLGATPGQTLHAAHSLPQDVVATASAGLASAWIDRRSIGAASGKGYRLPGVAFGTCSRAWPTWSAPTRNNCAPDWHGATDKSSG